MKTLQIVTLRVLVEAENQDEAMNQVDAALSFGTTIYHPQFLACVPFSPSKFIDELARKMDTTPIAIPFGNDYTLVDGGNGGLECLTGGESSAWVGVVDPNTGIEISTYISRCDKGVSIDLYGEPSEESIGSTYAHFADAEPDVEGVKTFEVFVTRDITETAIVKLKAFSKEEAEAKAVELSRTLNYSTDDGVKETYVSDCQEVA